MKIIESWNLELCVASVSVASSGIVAAKSMKQINSIQMHDSFVMRGSIRKYQFTL